MEPDATTFAPICIIDNFYKPINNRRPLAGDTFVEAAGRDDKNVGSFNLKLIEGTYVRRVAAV